LELSDADRILARRWTGRGDLFQFRCFAFEFFIAGERVVERGVVLLLVWTAAATSAATSTHPATAHATHSESTAALATLLLTATGAEVSASALAVGESAAAALSALAATALPTLSSAKALAAPALTAALGAAALTLVSTLSLTATLILAAATTLTSALAAALTTTLWSTLSSTLWAGTLGAVLRLGLRFGSRRFRSARRLGRTHGFRASLFGFGRWLGLWLCFCLGLARGGLALGFFIHHGWCLGHINL